MYIEFVDKIIRVASKRSYISCLIPVGILALLDYRYRFTSNFLSQTDKVSMLPSLSATFIGFLLMALTIFITMPKQTRYYEMFRKYGHDKIFARSCIFSAVFLFFYILLWMFSVETTMIAFYVFACGIAELIVVFYYAFRMTIDG